MAQWTEKQWAQLASKISSYVYEHANPTLMEFKKFIKNDVKDFVRGLLFYDKEFGMGRLKLNALNPTIKPLSHQNSLTNDVVYLQVQTPLEGLSYTITFELQITFTSPLLAQPLTENVGQISFSLPTMSGGFCEPEDDIIDWVLERNDPNVGTINISGTNYTINPEENFIQNQMFVRYVGDEYVGDIISFEPDSSLSSYMLCRYSPHTNNFIFSLNVTKLGQFFDIPLQTMMYICGFYDLGSATALVSNLNTDDVIEKYIVDKMYLIWTSKLENPSLKGLVEAQNIEVIYGQLKLQVKQENKNSFNNYNSFNLRNDLLKTMFMHTGVINDCETKAIYLGYFVRKVLLTALGRFPQTSRHVYENKKMRTATEQMKNVIRSAVDTSIKANVFQHLHPLRTEKTTKEITSIWQNSVSTIKTSLSQSRIKVSQEILLRTQSGTTFGKTQGNQGNRTVQSHSVGGKSMYGTEISNNTTYMKGVTAKVISEHENAKRKPQPTMIPFYDITYTTDSSTSVGTIRELASSATISTSCPVDCVMDWLNSNPLCSPIVNSNQFFDLDIIKIQINGLYTHTTYKPYEVCKQFRQDKIKQKLPPPASIACFYMESEIRILTTEGQLMSLTCPIEDKKLKLEEKDFDLDGTSVEKMLEQGKLCWYMAQYTVDTIFAYDIKDIEFSDYYSHTTFMMSSSNLHGLPIPQSSESKRNSMTTNQLKQSISTKPRRNARIPIKGEPSFVSSESSNYSCTINPSFKITGLNVLVAVGLGSAGGDVAEDSIELNKAITYTPMMTITKTTKITKALKHNQPTINPLGSTNKINTIYEEKLKHLDAYGIVKQGSHIKNGDIILCYAELVSNVHTFQYTTFTSADKGRVTSVVETTKLNKRHTINISIMYEEEIKDGDKFYISKAGKSVCRLVPSSDMPITLDGRHIGVVLSPLSPLKRYNNVPMSICSQQVIIEKAEENYDLSSGFNPDELQIFRTYGEQTVTTLYNPKTLKPYKNKFSVVYMHIDRNLNIATDKEHTKGRYNQDSGLNMDTQQAIQGRKNDGGLKFGVQEMWTMSSAGSSAAFSQIYKTNSDGRLYPVCKNCGLSDQTIFHRDQHVGICKRCGPNGDVGYQDTSFTSNHYLNVCHSRNVHIVKET